MYITTNDDFLHVSNISNTKEAPKKYLSCLKLNSKPACMANPSAPISDILLSAALLASNFKGNFLVGNSNTCQRQSNKSVFSGWAALLSICTSDLKYNHTTLFMAYDTIFSLIFNHLVVWSVRSDSGFFYHWLYFWHFSPRNFTYFLEWKVVQKAENDASSCVYFCLKSIFHFERCVVGSTSYYCKIVDFLVLGDRTLHILNEVIFML